MTARYSEAAARAAGLRKGLPEQSQVTHEAGVQVPKEVFDLFFQIQGECEKTGEMNYHMYAQKLWDRAFAAKGPATGPVFEQFEADLIRGMHDIQMKDLVYEDIQKQLPELIKALYDKAEKVILWSTGDTKATGYQDAKIASSRIAHDFVKTMIKEGHRDDVKERTDYMVSYDKNSVLEKYLQDKKDAGVATIKIAVVEDSRKNIDKVRSLVEKIFGPGGEVVSIWATYSREGKTAQKDPEKFAADKAKYNGINSFAELGSGEWTARLDGAEILVDFDGVIADNVKMRDRQAEVTYSAVLTAAKTLGVSEAGLLK
jgi:hypothetical protein